MKNTNHGVLRYLSAVLSELQRFPPAPRTQDTFQSMHVPQDKTQVSHVNKAVKLYVAIVNDLGDKKLNVFSKRYRDVFSGV
jgi:hypothetical protein